MGQRLGDIAVGKLHLLGHRVGNVQALTDAHRARDMDGIAHLDRLRKAEHLLLALKRLEDLLAHRSNPLPCLTPSSRPVAPGGYRLSDGPELLTVPEPFASVNSGSSRLLQPSNRRYARCVPDGGVRHGQTRSLMRQRHK